MESIRTDRGTHFTADAIEEVHRMLKIAHIKIVAYHPQGNGIYM